MPPKQKITIEMILEHAFKIAEELRQATFDYAGNKFVQEILAFENQPDFLQRTTKWVLDLARNKPNLSLRVW